MIAVFKDKITMTVQNFIQYLSVLFFSVPLSKYVDTLLLITRPSANKVDIYIYIYIYICMYNSIVTITVTVFSI